MTNDPLLDMIQETCRQLHLPQPKSASQKQQTIIYILCRTAVVTGLSASQLERMKSLRDASQEPTVITCLEQAYFNARQIEENGHHSLTENLSDRMNQLDLNIEKAVKEKKLRIGFELSCDRVAINATLREYKQRKRRQQIAQALHATAWISTGLLTLFILYWYTR